MQNTDLPNSLCKDVGKVALSRRPSSDTRGNGFFMYHVFKLIKRSWESFANLLLYGCFLEDHDFNMTMQGRATLLVLHTYNNEATQVVLHESGRTTIKA